MTVIGYKVSKGSNLKMIFFQVCIFQVLMPLWLTSIYFHKMKWQLLVNSNKKPKFMSENINMYLFPRPNKSRSIYNSIWHNWYANICFYKFNTFYLSIPLAKSERIKEKRLFKLPKNLSSKTLLIFTSASDRLILV